jgi:signal transduction histidine kinase
LSDTERGSAVFKPRARLLSLLGDQLITSEVVAVVELIKNSFDADATKVTLTLENVTSQEKGKIIIDDDGAGMRLDTVLNVWLEPGTEFRKMQREKGEKTQVFSRPLLGEKGIGRFAAHRLGNIIELITRAKDEEFEIEVEVNWRLFEGSRYLGDVPIYWMKRKPKIFTGNRHGTRIVIQDLKKPWTEEMVFALGEKLDALQAPLKEKYNFEIALIAPEFTKLVRKKIVLDEILKAATYSFEGYMDEKGCLDATYAFRHEAFSREARTLNVKEDARKEPQARKRFTTPNGELRSPLCGPFNVRFYAWDLDPTSLKETVTRKYYETTIKPRTGVRVYRDGFRVWPYGEQGNDWLNLDFRRVNNPTKCLSNNQVIGLVNISGDDNACLRDKTDREGIIENEAYADFKDLVLSAINLFEIERRKDRIKIAGLRRKERRIDKTIEAIGNLREKMKKRSEFGIYEKEVNDIENAYELEVRETIEPLIVSAGVGIAYMMPAHEIILSIQDLEKLIENLKADLARLGIGGRIAKTTGPMLEITNVIRDVADGALELTRRKGDVFSLRSAVDFSVYIKEPSLKASQIKINVNEKSSISIKGHKNLVMISILNLLDNSIYWLYENKEKIIQITIDHDQDKSPRIIVSDNGLGIRKEDLRYLGEAYWTRKPYGTGLGLFISKRAMRANNGKIDFGFLGEEPAFLSGANVILKFSREVEVRR